MSTQICITEYEGRVLTAVYENDVLAELWLQDGEESRVGDIYVGKIKNVVPNLRAAFVEFASGKMGYYQPEEDYGNFKKYILISPKGRGDK